MSKALNRIRKIERQAFRLWNKSARELVELYNTAITADASDRDEKHSLATFAAVRCQQDWERWQTLVGAIQDLEAEIHATNGRVTTRPPSPPPSPSKPAG